MSESVRSFVAIDLPGHVRMHLAGLQESLRHAGIAARWVRPAAIHLTLKFLGEVPAAQLESIGRGLAAAAEDVPAFSLAAFGLGVFPGVRGARVIWAGLQGELERLRQLQQGIEQQLAAAGIAREPRPFQAHLTLGRFGRSPQPRPLVCALAEFSRHGSDPFDITHVALFRSQLGAAGATYSILAQAALGGNVSQFAS
jgi:2'-5' RNA ligase